MKITSDLTNLTTAILILTVQMFIEWTLSVCGVARSPRFLLFRLFKYVSRGFLRCKPKR
jgi:hypothetical protein